MAYQNKKIAEIADVLKKRLEKKSGVNVLRSNEFKALSAELPRLKKDDRAAFGKELNKLREELDEKQKNQRQKSTEKSPIDVTAPFDVNSEKPKTLETSMGSMHPLTSEIKKIADIFVRMGFTIEESRLLDDEYHMFDSLNFPKGHPARDDYDTFMTKETDKNGHPFIAPAHTSTMQNRLLKKYSSNLEKGQPIAVLVPDRVFRNEDLDARHEHTFYQHEGIFVDRGVHAGMLIATLKAFFKEYFGKEVELKTQPFYFPFTEPSFELISSCVFCDRKGCNICSYSGWIELGGCGMIHPNVLKMADINPREYTGFAWGFGVERPVMLKYGIEDIRHFEAGKLSFLRQFS